VIEGNLVYDRSKDVRARHLLEGVEQNNAAPLNTGEEPVDPHSGKKVEDAKKKDASDDKGEKKKD